jgi:hypothetical protein
MDESRRSSATVAMVVTVAVALILPALYVLSVGPAIWLVNNGYLHDGLAEVFYTPVIIAAERFDWLRVALESYIELFE